MTRTCQKLKQVKADIKRMEDALQQRMDKSRGGDDRRPRNKFEQRKQYFDKVRSFNRNNRNSRTNYRGNVQEMEEMEELADRLSKLEAEADLDEEGQDDILRRSIADEEDALEASSKSSTSQKEDF